MYHKDEQVTATKTGGQCLYFESNTLLQHAEVLKYCVFQPAVRD